MGLSLDEFYAMTINEFSLRSFHFLYKQQLDWQRSNHIGMCMAGKDADIKPMIDSWFKEPEITETVIEVDMTEIDDFFASNGDKFFKQENNQVLTPEWIQKLKS